MVANAMMPLGAALTQPVVPAASTPPAADPSLWRKFLMKMEADPNFQQALLTTGLTLLGDPQPGESGFGTFSRAALTGVQTLDQLRARERQEGRQDTQLQIQQQGADASTERTNIARDSADIAATRTQQQADQFAQQLAEQQRQFDIRAAKGDFDGPSGQQSAVNARQDSAVEALVNTGRYPNTREGRSEALLYVQGLSGQVAPGQLMQLAMQEVERRRQNNIFLETPLTDAEITQQVFQDTQNILGMFQGANVPQPADATAAEQIKSDLDGMRVPGTNLTIIQVGPDQFKINNGQQNSAATLTEAEVRQRLNTK